MPPLLGEMLSDIQRGRFESAFRNAERLLDSHPSAETLEALMCPVSARGTSVAPGRICDLLVSLQKRRKDPAYGPWYAFLRACLLEALRWTQEAIREAESLYPLPRRYHWMRFNRALLLLRDRRDYAAAEKELAEVERSTPIFWKAGACRAEAALCRGDEGRAFGIMDRIVRSLSSRDDGLAHALAWRGEMRLWVGQYPQALKDLDKAVSLEAPLALCWRGATHLLLAKPEKALEDLDASLRRFPSDLEAFTWRGETKRHLGLWEQALEDLDKVVRANGAPLWALVNRGLVKERLGDIGGMRSDYAALPREVAFFFEWLLVRPLKNELRPEEMRAVLETLLKTARGVRRGDGYLYALWLPLP